MHKGKIQAYTHGILVALAVVSARREMTLTVKINVKP